MGLYDDVTQLASTYTDAKIQKLQAQVETPDSWIEGGGSEGSLDRFQERKAKRSQLKEYHKIRVDGGIIATLLEARALMVFGPGGQFTSEEDAVADWLNEQLNDRDTLVFDIGCDSYFYGYSLGEMLETNGGDFGKIELIQPWTTVPELDRKGEIDQWEQEIKTGAGKSTKDFHPDDVVHFKTMKASGRDPVGMSLLGRAMDEAKAYRDNQQAIQNAVKMQGFPKFHVKLGREGGAVIDDNELRRARPMFDNIHELTKWVTGQDVDIDVIEAENFEFEGITEHDLSKLAIAFMLPIELTQIGGGDGLGTGFPAKLRRQLFLLGARSHQRLLGDQLVQQVGRPLLEEYAPAGLFEGSVDDLELEYTFNDPITDVEEIQTKVSSIGEDMTVNERRDEFGLPPLDDDEVGDDFGSPDSAVGGLDAGKVELINSLGNWLTVDEARDLLGMDPLPDDVDPEEIGAPGRVGVIQTKTDEGEGGGDGDGIESLFSEGPLSEESERIWLRIYTDKVWSDGSDEALLQFSDTDVPEFVKDRIRQAIGDGALFSDFEDVPDSDLDDLREQFSDTLTEDGWSIDDLTKQIQGLEPDLDDSEAERIARTETQAVVNEARELGYEDRDDTDELRFRWVGPDDNRLTDTCEEIKERVPDDGLSLEALQETVEDVAKKHGHDPRKWTPHINCRHTYVREV